MEKSDSKRELGNYIRSQRERRLKSQFYRLQICLRNNRIVRSLESLVPRRGHAWNRVYEQLLHSSGLFHDEFYLSQYADVSAAGAEPLLHFLQFGGVERRHPSLLFDTSYYLDVNPDVLRSGMNPLVHYLLYGGFEGRNPIWLFDSEFYLRTNPDVAAAKMNPLVHYVRFGSMEERDPHPYFSSRHLKVAMAEPL